MIAAPMSTPIAEPPADLEADSSIGLADNSPPADGPPASQPLVRDLDRFTGHKVRMELFEGPLDLLLYLIRGHRYDICDIPMREITGQFVEFLRTLDELDKAAELDIEYAGDFCVTAATLMQIKARMLLPKDESKNEEEDEDEENDPRRELVQRLLEYQRMQDAAETLKEMRDERALLFSRPPLPLNLPKIGDMPSDAAALLKDVSTFDLLKALSRVLAKVEERQVAVVRREPFSLAERTRGVLSRLRSVASLSFEALCDDCESKLEVVITFLSILELVRRSRATVTQRAAFDEIWIEVIK